MTGPLRAEIAAAAARLIVEDGMEYGPAKRRAVKLLGLAPRGIELPDNESLEDEVRAYLALYCAESQPQELAALRTVALEWMERLADFRPHLTGAVWRGTATCLNDVHLELFCDDSKAAELALLDQRIPYDVSSTTGPRNEPVDVLSVSARGGPLGDPVTVHLTILDYDDLRGALKAGGRGGAQRGDLNALRALQADDR